MILLHKDGKSGAVVSNVHGKLKCGWLETFDFDALQTIYVGNDIKQF